MTSLWACVSACAAATLTLALAASQGAAQAPWGLPVVILANVAVAFVLLGFTPNTQVASRHRLTSAVRVAAVCLTVQLIGAAIVATTGSFTGVGAALVVLPAVPALVWCQAALWSSMWTAARA